MDFIIPLTASCDFKRFRVIHRGPAGCRENSVVARAAKDCICTRAPNKKITTITAEKKIITVIPGHLINSAFCKGQIITSATENNLIMIGAEDHIVAIFPEGQKDISAGIKEIVTIGT